MTREQVENLMVNAADWNEVNPDWPSLATAKYIPAETSGTMDFFVENFFLEQTLQDISYDGLVSLFAANVSAGRCKAVESEQRFYADRLVCDTEESFQARCESANPPTGCTLEPRDHASMEDLVYADIVQPVVLKSWFLIESLLNRSEISAEIAREYPSAEMKFKRWLTWDFVVSPQSSVPELAGVRTAILGSLWLVGIAILFAFPLGVGAAIYLEEYADKTNRFNQIIQTNINNLAGVPSIIYGLLGLAVFVRALEPITSGCVFGVVDCTVANGRTVLSGGLTLGLMVLPVIIISSQEAIRAVPSSLREASMGLGATKWQTVWSHVLPNAIGAILTGVILAMSRVIGETAPLVVVGAATFINTDPTTPFAKFTSLPTQIYQWTARPQQTFLNIAGAAIIVLLILLFVLNATAIFLRNRYSKRLG
ncbi:MAG: phosphate ABC transporter permease PstA [Chloroflexota bacterium]